MNLGSKFDHAVVRFSDWIAGLYTDQLLFAVFFLILSVVLRRLLAKVVTTIIRRVLAMFGITMPASVSASLERSIAVVVVTLALLVTLKIVSPGFADGAGQQILVSVIVLALYSSLYEQADIMIATLAPDGKTRLGTDTAWLVRLLRMAIVIMAFATITEVWGLSISGALTGVGVLGAGLAIAAQDFVNNFVSGLNNISENRFRPGDWIKVENGVEGTILSMDLRSTTVMGFDRVPRYVPNSDLANAVLMNYSRMDHRQIYWTIGIKRDATDQQVNAICADLTRYVHDSDEFVTDGSLLCFVVPTGLTDSAIDIMIYVFAKTASYQPYLEISGRLTRDYSEFCALTW